MPRLIDLILSRRGAIVPPVWNSKVMNLAEHREHQRHWKEAIDACRPFIFEASNVNEYFYNGTDQEFWKPDVDFPCMAPPSLMSWFEYNRPTGLTTNRKDQYVSRFNVHDLPKRTGVLVMLIEPGHGGDTKQFFDKVVARHLKTDSIWQQERRPVRDIASAKYLLQMLVFIQSGEGDDDPVIGPLSEDWLYLDENFDCFEYLMFTITDERAESPFPEGANTGMDNLVYPTMLSMTMLNLKNVHTHHNRPPHLDKKKLREKYVEQHGLPPVEYRTLEISPIAKLTAADIEARPSGAEGRKMRSHVYRGYVLRSGVDGRKHIFGNPKITGRFWVAPGKRGGQQAGQIMKDYRIGKVK
jgi:hypothetical protein